MAFFIHPLSIPKMPMHPGLRHKCFALFFFLGFLSTSPAYADDPFQFDRTNWMSFDRYKESTKPGAVPAATTTDSDANAAENSAPASDAHDTAGSAPDLVTPPTMAPTVAAPTRPINIPVMPGMNKGYSVQVNSTEDERPPLAQITHIDTQPTVFIPDRNWQTPKEAAQHPNADADGSDGDNERPPLDVRMSFLPNSQVTPVPSPEYKSTHGRKPPTAVAAVPPEKKAADAAACAAIDAYKKKQLEAIESDRQTLTALQKAIAQLGLQKELSFMAGGNVNQADSSTAKMDMPPSLAAAAKN